MNKNMNFFGGKGPFPRRKESKGGALEKLSLAQEAQRLDKFLNKSPQKIGDKKVYNVKGLAKVLKAETKGAVREIGDLLSKEGFGSLSSHEAINFLKENY